MSLEQNTAIARACHEANRAYCLAIGDTSQVSWDEAPDWQKESARVGVIKALEGATAEALHGSWLSQKVEDGWHYGAVKDAEKKTHPCIVAYDRLPPEQRAKDALFAGVVRAMADAFKQAYGG